MSTVTMRNRVVAIPLMIALRISSLMGLVAKKLMMTPPKSPRRETRRKLRASLGRWSNQSADRKSRPARDDSPAPDFPQA